MKKVLRIFAVIALVSLSVAKIQAQTVSVSSTAPSTNVVWAYDPDTGVTGIANTGFRYTTGNIFWPGQEFTPDDAGGEDIVASAFTFRVFNEGDIGSVTVRVSIIADTDGSGTIASTDTVIGSWDFDMNGIDPAANNDYLTFDIGGTVNLADKTLHSIQVQFLTLDAYSGAYRLRRTNSAVSGSTATTGGGTIGNRIGYNASSAPSYSTAADFPAGTDEVDFFANSNANSFPLIIQGMLTPVELSTFSIE